VQALEYQKYFLAEFIVELGREEGYLMSDKAVFDLALMIRVLQNDCEYVMC